MDHEADRAALRTLMSTVTDALNRNDFNLFSHNLAPGFHITFADQRTFTSPDELEAYRKSLLKDGDISKIEFSPEIDGPAIFLRDDIIIATGRSSDSFTTSHGTIVISSRWTATVIRDQNNTWKIASFHSGVNLLDNSILDRTKSALMRFVWIAGLVALIIGLLVGLLIGRRTKA